MSERIAFATKLDLGLRNKLQDLSKYSRIPQSKLLDEAIEDLLKKHETKDK